MSVAVYDPNAETISLSPEAAEFAKKQMAKDGASAVRLTVAESGCSGYRYGIEYVQSVQATDRLFVMDNGVEVYVQPEALSLLNGSVVVLVVEGLNKVLRFENPNADGTCGCGESFSVAS